MKPLLLLTVFALCASAQNLTLGWNAALTSWTYDFQHVAPGWPYRVHPGGIVDLQYKHIFAEAGGDPHRPREATTFMMGLAGDLFRHKRLSIEGRAGIGVLWAPSFLEACGSNYEEYQNCVPQLHCFALLANGKQVCQPAPIVPEYCPWGLVTVGFGAKVRVKQNFWIQPFRVEYLSPYALSPRWRVSAGFRIGLR